MITILAISGSLRSASSNTLILKALVDLIPQGTDISVFEGIGELPHFNPELDGDNVLAPVQKWRTHLAEADAVVFCTPEYAHGIPGTLKNSLDWLVSTGEFMHKPTAVISASPSPDGGDKASAALVQTLRAMMAKIPAGGILCIPGVSGKIGSRGEVTDVATRQSLCHLLETLVVLATGVK